MLITALILDLLVRYPGIILPHQFAVTELLENQFTLVRTALRLSPVSEDCPIPCAT